MAKQLFPYSQNSVPIMVSVLVVQC